MGEITMKAWMKTGIGALLCGVMMTGGAALADGSGEWHTSRLNGPVQLASYVGDYDGYQSVDGFGGVTASDAFTLTVISKSATVWSEAKTSSGKVASVKHGENLTAVQLPDYGNSIVDKNGFYQVEYKGKKGWINMDYVVHNVLEITLLESNVPAYIAPDRNSKKVGSLSKMTTYRVIGFYDDFYIINLRDAAAAYIPMSVKHRDNRFDVNYHGGGGMHVKGVTEGKANLRTGPGDNYPVIRELKSGTQVEVCDVIDDEWYLVTDSESGQWAFIAEYDVDADVF